MVLLDKVAPNQGQLLWTEMSRGTEDVNMDMGTQFQTLVAAYQEASTPFLQKQILSLFAGEHSKEFLMSSIPGWF